MKRIKEVNVLNVDENSIVAIHVNIDKIPNEYVDHYIKKMVRHFKRLGERKKVEFIVLPFRGEKLVTFEIIKKLKEKNDKRSF